MGDGAHLISSAQYIERMTDLTAVWTATVECLAEVGLTHIIYLSSDASGANVQCFATHPDTYKGLSTAKDPFLVYCCNSYDVMFIGGEYREDHTTLSEDDCKYIYQAYALGHKSAVAIPTRIAGSERVGGFNLGADMLRAEFEQKYTPLLEGLRLFCIIVHRRLEALAVEAVLPPDSPFVVGPPQQTNTLAPREREILTLIAKGMTQKQCARELGISPHTVADYLKSAYRKLDVHNRVEAIRKFHSMSG